jgi:hypothetical protein
MIWLQLGFEHILDPAGFDHMLFILAMLAPLSYKHLKEVALMITAFTLGHSVTLAWVSLSGPLLDSAIVEAGIAVTIFATALLALLPRTNQSVTVMRYALVALFGLIHGMGFTGYFTSLLGREQSVIVPLLSFNLGVEAGQLLFAGIMLLIQWVLVSLLNVSQRGWQLYLSGGASFVALTLILERI